jgi:Glycosyltransferase family 87
VRARLASLRDAAGPADAWVLLAALGALVLVNVPVLGSEPWDFRPGGVEARGPFAFFVRATDGEWDVEAVRAPALLAGVVVALAGAAALVVRRWPRWLLVALTVAVLALLLLPAVLLQAGLRQSTAPWFHTNDSTYQIELAGDLLREGENPYGHDYRFSGLERFYTLDGTASDETREEQVALRHFAYFPGTTLTAAVWSALPEPWSDYRFFVLLATFAGFAAALAFPGPLVWRLVAGAAIAASPLAVRAAWFGTADAPSLALTVLAFALVTRGRYAWAAASLGAAVLLKQFALLALPFLAIVVLQRAARRDAVRAAALFAGIVAAGVLPFLAWDPGAFWADTVEYGGRTYRIVGYGLSGLLLKAGVLESRTGPYPFLPLLALVWLPLTAWLVWRQARGRALWLAAACFAVSHFVLVFVARVFHGSYLVWPLAGLAIAALLAAIERTPPAAVDGARQRVPAVRSQVPGTPERR